LELVTMEASPTEYGEEGGTTFASVPYELLDRVASQPALFIFHTHADHADASPLPSSTDISLAITMGYNGRYAAWVLISRYGVFIYTPSWRAYKDIHGAKDPALALKHYRHDTVAAFEAMRSWTPWTLDDYSHLYQRHKMLYVVYPSPAYVADSYRLKFVSKQEAPDGIEILETLRRETGKSQKAN
jgi:hypothetical protein